MFVQHPAKFGIWWSFGKGDKAINAFHILLRKNTCPHFLSHTNIEENLFPVLKLKHQMFTVDSLVAIADMTNEKILWVKEFVESVISNPTFKSFSERLDLSYEKKGLLHCERRLKSS